MVSVEHIQRAAPMSFPPFILSLSVKQNIVELEYADTEQFSINGKGKLCFWQLCVW